MAKKKNKTWTILIVIIAIMYFLNFQGGVWFSIEGGKSAVYDKPELSECQTSQQNRIANGWQCVGECVEITETKNTCLESVGFTAGDVGEYGYVFDFDNPSLSCSQVSTAIVNQWNCMYPSNQIGGGTPPPDNGGEEDPVVNGGTSTTTTTDWEEKLKGYIPYIIGGFAIIIIFSMMFKKK